MADDDKKDIATSPKFEAGKQYRVQMRRTVQLPGVPGHMLRPSDDVVLSGEMAEQLKAEIASAVAID